jgi:DNA-binding SARP family transcriptional activator
MEFGLLGPLVVRRGTVPVPVASRKQRVVLAALLLRAGRPVTMDDLAEALWGCEPPPSARATIQNYVMRLRRILACPGPAVILTQPDGYLISAGAGDLDVSRFERLLAEARAAARKQSWEAAAARAGEALALWRGEPLAEGGSEFLALREGPWLAEMRLQAVEARIEAELHLGLEAEVVAELRHLVVAHPLRERLHAQLMLALHRCGRRAEALAAYQDARRVLVRQLGAEPGNELRELHQRMLSDDPALDVPGDPGQAATPTSARPAMPRELPGAAASFVGRTAELAALTRLLERGGGAAPGAVVISVIGGTAGVGKTALAVQWAHSVAGRFPDGQLYVNLRGYDPGQPVLASAALAGFLRALGVPGRDIPVAEDERAARYRSLLAGRRVLVVLDNAASEEQARPLLPGARGCAAVVTSRDALAGLVARDGALRLELDLLPPGDAVGLLRALIGARVDAEPEPAAALAAQCARLPLALRLAAQLGQARPAASLAGLAGELADQQRRLDLLDAGGDPRTAVRAVLSWSYRHLDAATASGFRLLGLHPGPDLDLRAAAALTGLAPGQAARLLGRLAQAHLIQPARPGRYGMHDLLRAYATEQATCQDSERERRAALTRLSDHYQRDNAAAAGIPAPAAGQPAEGRRKPSRTAHVLTAETAHAWLDVGRSSLAAVARTGPACPPSRSAAPAAANARTP